MFAGCDVTTRLHDYVTFFYVSIMRYGFDYRMSGIHLVILIAGCVVAVSW